MDGNITGNVYGYIRVSSREQNEDRQMIALRKTGIHERNIFTDRQSGKDFVRPQYKRLLRKIKKDEILRAHLIQNYDKVQGLKTA